VNRRLRRSLAGSLSFMRRRPSARARHTRARRRSRRGRPGRQLARSPIASAGRTLLDRMQRALYESQRLAAGGRRIRTLGPTSEDSIFSRPPRIRRRQTGPVASAGFDDRQVQIYPSPRVPGNSGSPSCPNELGTESQPLRSLVASLRCCWRWASSAPSHGSLVGRSSWYRDI
jgi:hypothetical protein